MRRRNYIILTAFITAILMLSLTGCGQKGALYMPTHSTPITQAP
ncbi:LPS translocon maturation chaperone LptM [Piscirickettsia salmonis]|nr:lipoprotein [Piscirickettsia salmonis]QHS27954.1 lipoprotein [Piscirickettsia salmonis]